MNLIQMIDGRKQMGSKLLFESASVSINEGEHVGVIGPNGAGKTTMFKIFAGLEELDEGKVIKSSQLKLGYLKQESDWQVDLSVEDFVKKDSQQPIWEIKKWGSKLGITESLYQQSISTLSGGYRMRVQLLKLLAAEPNLLLLDEPTNFLDLETTLVLENFLQFYPGAFLLISHDREFLKRTTDHIVEVELGEITKFPGNIEDYFEQKQELRQQQLAQAKNQELKRKKMQEFVDRFRAKATKAKQAQSRLKMLDKMELIEIKDLPVRAQIPIPKPIATGKETLRTENLDVGFETKKILSNVNFRLSRGDHLAIVGVNGAGKSTLLKSIAAKIPVLSGEVIYGHQVEISYFAQHSTDELDLNESIVQALQRKAHPDVTLQEIKNMAGALLFAGDDIDKKIKVLSGGEKSRVALGQVLLQKKPVLILDEPTNHLDFDTVEALTQALNKFEGSLLFVSHDRGFVRRLATKLLEIHQGKAEFYPGSYDDYVWRQGQILKDSQQQDSSSTNRSDNKSEPKSDSSSSDVKNMSRIQIREEQKSVDSNLKKIKKLMAELESTIYRMQKEREELVIQSGSVSGQQASDLFRRLAEVEKTIEETEITLLESMETEQCLLQRKELLK